MNELPETPAPAPEGRLSSVFQTWRAALTRPNEQTYANIASGPNARASTAYLWVFIASLIQIFLAALVQSRFYPEIAQQLGLDPSVFGPRGNLTTVLTSALCGAPIGAAITTMVFAIWVAVVQWLAKAFGGTGTYDRLAYAIAAILAPYSILVGILSLFSAIPYAGVCFGLLGFLAAIYILVLQLMAIKGVNQVSWGAAIGAFFIPALVVGVICACLASALVAALVPVLREVSPGIR